jgi:hypothetical protein
MGRLMNYIAWWQWLPVPWRRWRIVLCVEAGDEVPEQLPSRGAVLVAPDGRPTWLAFDCPCGTGHRIMLNLSESRRPRWTLSDHTPLTLSPSIDDVGVGRRCHFFLQRGKIQWARHSSAAAGQ